MSAIFYSVISSYSPLLNRSASSFSFVILLLAIMPPYGMWLGQWASALEVFIKLCSFANSSAF